jgi:hypothetical protein
MHAVAIVLHVALQKSSDRWSELFFGGSALSGVVGIATAILVLLGTEVDVEDLAYALHVHHLSHRLAACVDGNEVIPGIDQIACSTASEESRSPTTTFSARSATRGATDRCFSGA